MADEELKSYEFFIGTDIRAYGYVTVDAASYEEARAQITTHLIQEEFEHNGDLSFDNLQNSTLLRVEGDDHEASDLCEDIPNDYFGLPWLSEERARVLYTALNMLHLVDPSSHTTEMLAELQEQAEVQELTLKVTK